MSSLPSSSSLEEFPPLSAASSQTPQKGKHNKMLRGGAAGKSKWAAPATPQFAPQTDSNDVSLATAGGPDEAEQQQTPLKNPILEAAADDSITSPPPPAAACTTVPAESSPFIPSPPPIDSSFLSPSASATGGLPHQPLHTVSSRRHSAFLQERIDVFERVSSPDTSPTSSPQRSRRASVLRSPPTTTGHAVASPLMRGLISGTEVSLDGDDDAQMMLLSPIVSHHEQPMREAHTFQPTTSPSSFASPEAAGEASFVSPPESQIAPEYFDGAEADPASAAAAAASLAQRISFGAMPSSADVSRENIFLSPGETSLGGGHGDLSGSGSSRMMLGALQRPSFIGSEEGCEEGEDAGMMGVIHDDSQAHLEEDASFRSPGGASASASSSKAHRATAGSDSTHATPVAAADTPSTGAAAGTSSGSSLDDSTAAGVVSPSTYFASRSAPSGSLSGSRPTTRPTFQTPEYLTERAIPLGTTDSPAPDTRGEIQPMRTPTPQQADRSPASPHQTNTPIPFSTTPATVSAPAAAMTVGAGPVMPAPQQPAFSAQSSPAASQPQQPRQPQPFTGRGSMAFMQMSATKAITPTTPAAPTAASPSTTASAAAAASSSFSTSSSRIPVYHAAGTSSATSSGTIAVSPSSVGLSTSSRPTASAIPIAATSTLLWTRANSTSNEGAARATAAASPSGAAASPAAVSAMASPFSSTSATRLASSSPLTSSPSPDVLRQQPLSLASPAVPLYAGVGSAYLLPTAALASGGDRVGVSATAAQFASPSVASATGAQARLSGLFSATQSATPAAAAAAVASPSPSPVGGSRGATFLSPPSASSGGGPTSSLFSGMASPSPIRGPANTLATMTTMMNDRQQQTPYHLVSSPPFTPSASHGYGFGSGSGSGDGRGDGVSVNNRSTTTTTTTMITATSLKTNATTIAHHQLQQQREHSSSTSISTVPISHAASSADAMNLLLASSTSSSPSPSGPTLSPLPSLASSPRFQRLAFNNNNQLDLNSSGATSGDLGTSTGGGVIEVLNREVFLSSSSAAGGALSLAYPLTVQVSSRLTRLHRFCLFEVDPTTISDSTALQKLVDAYLRSLFAGREAAQALVLHRLHSHATSHNVWTLLFICDPTAAGAAATLGGDAWMHDFIALVASKVACRVATPPATGSSTVGARAPAHYAVRFLEERPIAWHRQQQQQQQATSTRRR